jgi:hypothetical protein
MTTRRALYKSLPWSTPHHLTGLRLSLSLKFAYRSFDSTLVGPTGVRVSPLPVLCEHTGKIYGEARTIASRMIKAREQKCRTIRQEKLKG